jgi:hypothetical protein
MNTSRDKLSAIAPTVDERAGLAKLQDGMRRSTRHRRIARGAIAAVCVVALVGTFVAVKGSMHDANFTTLASEPTSAPNTTGPNTTGPDSSATTIPQTTTTFVPDPSVRCPAPPFVLPAWDEATNAAYGESQGELRSDAEAAQRYLATSEDGLDLQYAQVVPARLTVRVSGRVEETREALSKRLSHPDRVDVELVPYTKADVKRVSAEIIVEAQANQGVFNTFSGPVEATNVPSVLIVGLNPGQEARAAEYVQRWGPIVRIEIAGQPYVPKGCGPQSQAPTCFDVAAGDPAAAKVELSLTLAKSAFTVAEVGQATLRVHNLGTETFNASSGPEIVGVVVQPSTSHVVGQFTGAARLSLIVRPIAPGESADIPVIFGAARCDGGEGSALPPGVYGLRAVLGADPRTPGSGYMSPEIPVTLTAS